VAGFVAGGPAFRAGSKLAAWLAENFEFGSLPGVLTIIRPRVPDVSALTRSAAALARHHVFPQEFAAEFQEIGIAIHEYTLEIPAELHQTIHAAGWNADWAEFLYESTILPSAHEAMTQATRMIYEHGLAGYLPFVPYR
jgi:cyclopropane fatty-acyl-phospholipid synthase-like methyltransferase